MLEIFSFYIRIIGQIFSEVMQRFEVASGIGYGTFLIACGILVAFINLLKFGYDSTYLGSIKKNHLDNENKDNKDNSGFGNRNFGEHLRGKRK